MFNIILNINNRIYLIIIIVYKIKTVGSIVGVYQYTPTNYTIQCGPFNTSLHISWLVKRLCYRHNISACSLRAGHDELYTN